MLPFRLLAIADDELSARRGLSLSRLIEGLAAGATAHAEAHPVDRPVALGVVLRLKRSTPAQVRDALACAESVSRGAPSVAWLLNGPADIATPPWLYGRHLPSGAPPLAAGARAGRSCHSERGLHAARAEGARWAMISPVFAPTSKPLAVPPIGVHQLGALVASVPELPLFALGGILPENVDSVLASGVWGVSALGHLHDDAPARRVRELLDAIERGLPQPPQIDL